MDLIERLHLMFLEQGYVWKIGGELTIPTQDDIRAVLDRMTVALYDEKNETQIALGRLIMVKSDDHLDVYIHMGDYNND